MIKWLQRWEKRSDNIEITGRGNNQRRIEWKNKDKRRWKRRGTPRKVYRIWTLVLLNEWIFHIIFTVNKILAQMKIMSDTVYNDFM